MWTLLGHRAGVRDERSRPVNQREQIFRRLPSDVPAKRQLESWCKTGVPSQPEVFCFGGHAKDRPYRERLEPLIQPTADRRWVIARPVMELGAVGVAVQRFYPQVEVVYHVFLAVPDGHTQGERSIRRSDIRNFEPDVRPIDAMKP
jgi:hypothetical protein